MVSIPNQIHVRIEGSTCALCLIECWHMICARLCSSLSADLLYLDVLEGVSGSCVVLFVIGMYMYVYTARQHAA